MKINPPLVPREKQIPLLKDFLKEHSSDVASVPEHVFVRNILQFLVQPEPSDNTFAPWIKHAGHITNELSVRGPNGEELFRCPAPLYHPHTRRPEERGEGPTLDQIGHAATLHDLRFPGAGAMLIEAETQDLIRPPTDLEVHQSRWNAVLARYGLPPIPGSREYVAAETVVEEAAEPKVEALEFEDEDAEI